MPSTPRKALLLEPARGLGLEWAWGWELVSDVGELVLELVLELVKNR
jgi:hypothetical protein